MNEKKPYRLAVSDFDGTLLRSDDTISQRTRDAIAAFRAKGGIFTVCTGRMHRSIAARMREVGLTGRYPLLSFQGGLVRDSESGETLLAHPLSRELAAEMADFCKAHGIYCHVYDYDNLYIPRPTEYNEWYCRVQRVTPTVVGDIGSFLRANALPVAKFLIIEQPERMDETRRLMDAAFGTRAQIVRSHSWLLETIALDSGKGNGLRFIAELYGIPIEQTIAIGDELNDSSMIEAAGLGVAVGNAAAGLKEKADLITVSNDEDAVAVILETYGL